MSVQTDLPCRQAELADAVAHWAAEDGARPALTFLTYSGRQRSEQTLSYAGLDRSARAWAARLATFTAPGDRVALMLGQSLDYIEAFLGCLYAGRVAVPLYAPDARRSDERLVAVLADARPTAVITLADAAADVDELVAGTGIRVLLADSAEPPVDGFPATFTPVRGDGTAYLQYTSGSTRTPAGVQVTARNLAVAMTQLRESLPMAEGPMVSWLPYFHDMGLVYGICAVLQGGGHCWSMSPMSFVQRPSRFLQALSDAGAALTIVPNFAVDLCVRRVPESEREGLDLSRLRAFGNGSEPIRASSMTEFSDAYAPYGFDPLAHQPGYGLAEATLMVTAHRYGSPLSVARLSRAALAEGVAVTASPDAPAENVAEVVSCGVPVDQAVRIVDPASLAVVSDDSVGEVWVHGDNVCRGYTGRAGLTAEIFGGRLRDSPDAGTWLRTGDLGFLSDGELFLVGRLKDLIIVAGKNHYPADVEATVADAVAEIRAGGVVAMPTRGDGPEGLVVVAEIEPRSLASLDHARTALAVRAAVAAVHAITPADIVLVRSGTIPRTTSGKLQRRACSARYEAGEFK
jgi:acyl-CoA synthetase (AMP-forming)/AMP-acid ligase II